MENKAKTLPTNEEAIQLMTAIIQGNNELMAKATSILK